MLCAWASISEKGSVNGQKGDQTKKEVKIGNYYNFGQTKFIRFKDVNIAKRIAIAAGRIAINDNIGYGQTDRASSYALFHNIKWNIDKIKEVGQSNTDCSEMALSCVNFALGKEVLSALLYTGNLQSGIICMSKKENIDVVVYDKLKESELKAGDIVLAPGHHVIVCIGNVDYNYKTSTKRVANYSPILKKGSKGEEVKILQDNLNKALGCKLVIDGDFGKNTDEQLRVFQKKYKLEVDGEYGKNTATKLKNVLGYK